MMHRVHVDNNRAIGTVYWCHAVVLGTVRICFGVQQRLGGVAVVGCDSVEQRRQAFVVVHVHFHQLQRDTNVLGVCVAYTACIAARHSSRQRVLTSLCFNNSSMADNAPVYAAACNGYQPTSSTFTIYYCYYSFLKTIYLHLSMVCSWLRAQTTLQ